MQYWNLIFFTYTLVLIYFLVNKLVDARKIKGQQKLIDQISAQKDILLKEIQHRVKNNLQVMASLLNLLSRSSGPKDSHNIMEESRQRIRSMAVIHQTLYRENHLMGVDSRYYINQLCQTLLLTKRNGRDVDLRLNIKRIWLEVEATITIGYIIDELLSFALVHHVMPDQKKKIYVELTNENNIISLNVSNNGKSAFSSNKTQLDQLSYKLLTSFVRKLKGELTLSLDGQFKANILFKTRDVLGNFGENALSQKNPIDTITLRAI